MIHIENPKCPIEIYGKLKKIRDKNFEFTPDVMVSLLKCSNHQTSIRDLLKEIPEGKEAEFKEAILEMADRREHTNKNLETMRDIAKRGGFEAEFEEVSGRPNVIGNTYNLRKVLQVKTLKEYHNMIDKFKDYDEVVVDLSSGGIYPKGNCIEINNVRKLPRSMKFVGCTRVEFCDKTDNVRLNLSNINLEFEKCYYINMENIIPPKGMDVSKVENVYVRKSDLSLFNLNHKDISVVVQDCVINNNDKVLDVSLTKSARISRCVEVFKKVIAGNSLVIDEVGRSLGRILNKIELDLKNTEDADIYSFDSSYINLTNHENVRTFTFDKNIPAGVDVSKSINVMYRGEVNDNISSIKFNPNKTVSFFGSEARNKDVKSEWLSNINNIELRGYTLLDGLAFKEGGTVFIKYCNIGGSDENNPNVYDFSRCEKVEIDDKTIENMKYSKFILKDKEQRKKIFGNKFPSKAKFEYKDDKKLSFFERIRERF